jgi:hypothetical protein
MTARSFAPHALSALASVAVAALVFTGTSSAAVDAGSKLRFSALPKRVVQGNQATVAVGVKGGGRCSLTVRYGDGTLQPGLATVRAAAGRARWSWRVPDTAATGPAKLIVTCGSAGRLVGSLPVIAGPKPNNIVVEEAGGSQRTQYGHSQASWGVVLYNPSPDRDALDVNVLLNFVDATNTVLGTDTAQIDGIAAGSRFYLGGGANVPTTTITKLEVTVTVGSRAPRVVHEPPIADIRLVPGADGYLDSVVGQVTNDRSGQVLTTANMTAVLFDAAGKVVGGTSGGVYSSLPWQTRAFWSASSYADPVPMTRAATAKVSVEPKWEVKG